VVLLEVEVTGLKLKHPVMNASGVLATSVEGVRKLVEAGVSAVVTKTTTLQPREGYQPPIVIPLGCGLVNAVGLQNPGPRGLCEVIGEAKRAGVPAVASIGGSSVEEYAELAALAEECGADAVELNLSCPNVPGFGAKAGVSQERVVESVKSTVKIPVWAKLSYTREIVSEAGRVLAAGADALVLINTIPALVIDVYARKPVLTNITGGLSGPPIHPVMLYTVYSIYREHRCEIIGVGGVVDWASALDTILAGARAIQIATGFYLKGYSVVSEVLTGIVKYMEEIGAKSIEELVGAAHA